MFKSVWSRWALCASLIVMTSGMLACGEDDEGGDAAKKGGQAMRGKAGGRPGGATAGRGGGGAAIPVEARAIDRGDISVSLQTYTSIEAERHVDVVSRTQGLVRTIFVEEGANVSKGQPLAQLDDSELLLTVQEREVNLQSLKATYDRAQDLLAKELLSTQEFEQTKFQYEAAKTQLETAKLNLEYATIRAPFTGTITDRMIEVGNLVNANVAVFRAADFTPLLARIFVPERQIRAVKIGQSVRITIEGSSETFTGRVRMVNPVVDPGSGTVKVTVEVSDKTRTLRPGMFATVNIITNVHANVVRVEKRALVSESEGTFAFLFNGGNAKKVRIELGEDEGSWVEVMSGLSDGDSIITVGHEGLRNGAPVRIAGEPVAPMAGGGKGDQKMSMQGRQGGQSGQASPGGGQGMRGGQGGGSQMDLGRMKERMLQNPKVKEEYDKRVKADASFEKDEEKQREFFRGMMQQMRGQGGGGRRPQ